MPSLESVSLSSRQGRRQITAERRDELMKVARRLEATFLAEMLKSAGLGEVKQSFGGGIGEEQFGSFMREAQAKMMVKRGGLGLARSLFESLAAREGLKTGAKEPGHGR